MTVPLVPTVFFGGFACLTPPLPRARENRFGNGAVATTAARAQRQECFAFVARHSGLPAGSRRENSLSGWSKDLSRFSSRSVSRKHLKGWTPNGGTLVPRSVSTLQGVGLVSSSASSLAVGSVVGGDIGERRGENS
jgi:hypothetical protein